VIASFKHRGLRKLYEDDDRSKLNPDHVEKLATILAHLDEAGDVGHMALPGFYLHPLKGDRKGFWAVTVSANWRVVFRFENGPRVRR
jgi:proteic killer suppression protein